MALLGTATASVLNKIVWLAALQKQGPPRCGRAADMLQGVAQHFGSPLRIVELGAVAHPAGMNGHVETHSRLLCGAIEHRLPKNLLT